MEHVSFVILHYLSSDITEECVDSIQKNIRYKYYDIVIVDNGSPNNSGDYLKEKYKDKKNVTVILLTENKGFANGNNIGYEFARNQLNSKYIIITNSDTVFEQFDFIVKLKSIYEKMNYDVLGPDIITPTGLHQNPHREKPMSIQQVRKMLLIKSIFLRYFQLKKVLHLNDKIQILERMYIKKDLKAQKKIRHLTVKEGIVPQGACIIFSPQFIMQEKYAFNPKTFMYGEEDLLTFHCIIKGYKILYSPEVHVIHLNGETTKKKYRNSLDKNIFTYKYVVEGCKILLNLMKNS